MALTRRQSKLLKDQGKEGTEKFESTSSEKIDEEETDNIEDKPTETLSMTGESSDDEEEESEEEEDSDSEQESDSDEESDEEDLDELLNNAQTALRKQKQFEEAEKEDDDAKTKFTIPKLETGINMSEQLYIKNDKGVARLVEDSVALVDEDNNGGPQKRQVEVLKTSKPEEKKMSRKERQQEREKTAGKGWFDMPKPELTPEMKRDLQVLKMRHVIDPKRHYKKFGKGEEPKYFQTGTIIEGATEFFSSRINRKDRKQTIVDELLADDSARSYHKRKHLEAQARGRNGRKKVKREMKRL